nr:lytic transglycosylase domain-containing protein [Desulfoprunum benzoelyticum]
MIPAIAWQESCFRQFVVRDDKLTYLLSYNNSSVGLMQVNTRVWRGVYDLERLRWDIRYNAAAGCEIATLYLKDYALRERKGQKKPDNETIAHLVYAMYNGGPGQYRKYLERQRNGKLYASDKLFQEKFKWVSAADWGKISKCLIGG